LPPTRVGAGRIQKLTELALVKGIALSAKFCKFLNSNQF